MTMRVNSVLILVKRGNMLGSTYPGGLVTESIWGIVTEHTDVDYVLRVCGVYDPEYPVK